MPPKKAAKATPSVTRGRSKSAGRTPSKARSRTPRSRSRSRVTTPRTTRTPASESKIRRRRSSSSSSHDLVVTRIAKKSGIDASGDKRQGIATLQCEPVPSRFSQRIIEKIEAARPNHQTSDKITATNEQPTACDQKWLQKISKFFMDRFCTSPIVALLSMLMSIGFLFWLNLLVFQPSGSDFFGKPEPRLDRWGPGYTFLGAIWPNNWRVYFNMPSASLVMFYFSVNIVLALIFPVGLLAGLFFFSIFGALQYGVLKDYGIMTPSRYVEKYWVGMLTSTSVLVVLSAILVKCLVKRIPHGQVCKEGNTGNFLLYMKNGRWVRPSWCGLDWKMFLLRTSMIGIAMVDICFGFIQWKNYQRISPALAATIFMELVQVMNYLVFEFVVNQFSFFFRPACISLVGPSKPDIGRLTTADGEVLTNNVVLLCSAGLLFLVGYWIYSNSNGQKSLFCQQPNHSLFSGMPKIAVLHGQSILAGGWWGVVRHPNYLGNILMVTAIGLTTGCSSVIPWIYPSAVVVMLLHRLFRMEHANLEEFGLQYEMYKKLVPCKLLPKLF